MYSVADLTTRFHNLDAEHKIQVFEELTKNANLYNRIFPNMPLVMYILGGEEAVPVNQQGPIIQQYKAWQANQQ